MFKDFEKYMQGKAELTTEELQQISDASIPKKIRKKHYLLQEGDISRHRAFVCKGCLRMYRATEDGSEHILRFVPENWWAADAESFITGVAAKTNIQALEDSEVLLWTKEGFDELLRTIPTLKTWSEQLLTKNITAHQNRIYSNISSTAGEKYQDFITAYPDIYNRVPLHMIASYLGLSSKTLTRIRQQAMHR